jgi:hypothetical protein
MEATSHFKNVAPPRSACVFAALSALFFLVMSVLSGEGLTLTNLLIAFALVCLLLGSISALLLRKHWVYGVSPKETGFLFRAPLRKPRFIAYTAIDRIVASSILNGGHGESATTLIIKSSQGTAWVEPGLVFTSGILSVLKALPGFDHDAWKNSSVPENSFWRNVFPKRTTVFERRNIHV